MPLVDSLNIKASALKKMVQPGNSQSDVIEGFLDLLPSVGWDHTGSFYATADISYPFLLPSTPGSGVPSRVVGCRPVFPWLTIGANTFSFYNPHTEIPDPTALCTMVAWGDTGNDSLTNLAGAISSATVFDGAVILVGGVYTIRITAKFPGSLYNWIRVIGDGSFGASDPYSTGGGYEFESKEESPILTGMDGTTSKYKVKIYSAGAGLALQQLIFLFTANGGQFSYILDTVPFSGPPIGQYSLWANAYSFAIWDGTTDPYSSDLRASTLFAAAPFIPTVNEGFQAAYAVVVIGPHNLPTQTAYTQFTSTEVLDALPFSTSLYLATPRLMSLSSPNSPALLTPDGRPPVTTAWIMMSNGSTVQPSIVGRLWDGAIVNGSITIGAILAGIRYITLGVQVGNSGRTATSLIVAIEPEP